MATYTDNYNLKKPTYAEPANVKDINENMDIVDDIMHSSQVSLADAYDLNSTYNTGDKVMYEMLMYKCKEDGVTGAWDASKWERTTAVEGSGGADLDIYGEASGTAEASFSDGAEASLVECEIGIEPQQDLHGYSKPWAGGAGKNKLPNTGNTTVTPQGITFTVNSDGSVTANGTATATATFRMVTTADLYKLPAGNYIISGGKGANRAIGFKTVDGTTQYNNGGDTPFTLSEETTWDYIFIRIASGELLDNETFYPMIRTSGDSTFEPYSNICPISGHTDVTVTVASTSGGSGEDTTVSLGRTVYGGSLDVTTGELTVTHTIVNVGSLSWTRTTDYNNPIFYAQITDKMNSSIDSICEWYANGGLITGPTTINALQNGYFGCGNNSKNIYVRDDQYTSVSDFTSATASVKFYYELATPQTFNLTPTQVKTLLGQNYISHDGGGTISLVYIKKDSTIIPNPAGAEIPLTGLEINGEKFKIESGGYHKALIWDSGSPTVGASYATDYALLDNLSNYNQIILMVSTTGDRADANHQYSYQIWLDVEYLLSSGAWHNANVSGYGTRYFEASFTDSSFRIIQGGGEGGYTPTIFQIYGVRY